MNRLEESPFQRLLRGTRNPVRLCQFTVLAWVAACDGKVTADEHALLRRLVGADAEFSEFFQALEVARQGRPNEMYLACELVARLDRDSRRRFLAHAIEMAVSDGKLAIPENHLLRFLADLTRWDLPALYRDVTGQELPFPGDPSSINWWEMRERARAARRVEKQEAARAERRQRKADKRRRRDSMTRAQALAVLGLEEDADEQQIRRTYRWLASVHHPDRFREVGPEVERSAALTFARIKTAFETLVRS